MIKRLMIVIIGLFLVATPTFALSTTGLWAYYDMETGGNTPDDITGNGKDLSGTSLGTRPSVNTGGIYGSALEYSGSTSSNIAYHPNSWTGTKYSLSGWIKGDAGSFSSSLFPAIAVSGQYSSGGTWHGIGGGSGSTDFVRVHLGSTSSTDSSAGSISEGVWQHVVITYDSVNNEVKIYVEGSLVHTYTGSVNAITSTAREFAIGARDGGTNSIANEFDGLLDEISWFENRILTASEVSELYNSGYGLFYNSTSGAFDIDPLNPPVPNANPNITAIADQSMNEDTTLNVPSAFNISDAEDPISSLTLSYSGYNTSLLNTTSISFDVNTTTGVVDMSITPLPDAYGVTNVTINVTDSSAGTASDTFLLTIFNVNDAPTITAISSPQIVTESNTLVINFNVTDIDNPYTDLIYSAVAGDTSLISSATFSNYDGTNQTLTIVAPADFGKTDINVSVRDLQPAIASTTFDYIVNCNTTTSYYSPMNVTEQEFVGSTTPTTCFEQSFTYNTITDILTYTWHDFGSTMNNIKFWAYDTTGNFRIPLNETTLTGNNGTLTIDYSAVNPNYNILAIADLTDNTRSFYTGSGVSSTARVLDVNIDQAGQLGSLFSVSDGIVYGVLILLLFLTLGIASQSASLTLIFSILGLFIASKFVLRIPSQFIWITGALVVILLYLIAKLRTD